MLFVAVTAIVTVTAAAIVGYRSGYTVPVHLGLFAATAVTLCAAVLSTVSALVVEFFSADDAEPERRDARHWRALHWSMGAFVPSLTLLLVLVPFGDSVRRQALERIPERAQPILRALAAYEEQLGEPPESLGALIPDWIDAIPSTGMAAHPAFVFMPAEDRDPLPPSWSLRVPCSSGLVNWDVFLDYPDRNYEGAGERWGGWGEPIGDWLYVHE